MDDIGKETSRGVSDEAGSITRSPRAITLFSDVGSATALSASLCEMFLAAAYCARALPAAEGSEEVFSGLILTGRPFCAPSRSRVPSADLEGPE
ncbi:hypothetical protein [Salipiger abyssi]|uniref:hypothetical protein n=1 Tax=Salipiger abyssi TaxID=1250539 RepID=UPI0018DC14AB|nr:hypothetical protein [Salipiger abyssi]